MKTSITPGLIRDALAHYPACCTREEWARVAMAIKSEFPDDIGFALFDQWSATADGYDPRATGSTWRSIKAGGGVGIGTLLHLAKQNGFTLPKPDQVAAPPNRAELERLEREREQRLGAELEAKRAAQAHAAREAARLWELSLIHI